MFHSLIRSIRKFGISSKIFGSSRLLRYCIFFFLLVFAWGCAPKYILINLNPEKEIIATKSYESFAVIESDSTQLEDKVLLGEIEIKDQGFSVDCDYETVKKLAIEEARKIGGNCLVIKEHKLPDFKSTCHRIKCDIFRIPNAHDFEKHITWHPIRPLQIADFKGTTEKRPFQAVTSSSLRYYLISSPLTGKTIVTVENIFNCELSYFIQSEQDSMILQHEQIHFDITEIYARKFRKIIQEEIPSGKAFLDQHEQIFYEIQKACQLKQDEYDSEVYDDHSLQKKWNDWSKEMLLSLSAYSDPKIIISKKKKE